MARIRRACSAVRKNYSTPNQADHGIRRQVVNDRIGIITFPLATHDGGMNSFWTNSKSCPPFLAAHVVCFLFLLALCFHLVICGAQASSGPIRKEIGHTFAPRLRGKGNFERVPRPHYSVLAADAALHGSHPCGLPFETWGEPACAALTRPTGTPCRTPAREAFHLLRC
jgi:hypothetical protein